VDEGKDQMVRVQMHHQEVKLALERLYKHNLKQAATEQQRLRENLARAEARAEGAEELVREVVLAKADAAQEEIHQCSTSKKGEEGSQEEEGQEDGQTRQELSQQR
jgi:alkylation response protein AidB-like acyl-CoA dehydrogenase